MIIIIPEKYRRAVIKVCLTNNSNRKGNFFLGNNKNSTVTKNIIKDERLTNGSKLFNPNSSKKENKPP